ncbi:hypothetical protein DSO57_1030789 [Entomophthora muscae]|uniref:Uncharacterized protein n=1 Tax=Entomophthora muscae TaxID=34485 RepID=A0ACC2S2Y1_9FUNG|nr:hypothetical protein DSO57_1030789 [Entomophthora muscae]
MPRPAIQPLDSDRQKHRRNRAETSSSDKIAFKLCKARDRSARRQNKPKAAKITCAPGNISKAMPILAQPASKR